MHHPTDRIAHTTACYTSHGALVGMRNSSMDPPPRGLLEVDELSLFANRLKIYISITSLMAHLNGTLIMKIALINNNKY